MLLLQKCFPVCREVAWRGSCNLPYSLLFHQYRSASTLAPTPAPLHAAAAVSRPLWGIFSTAGSLNSGPLALDVLMNRLLHCFDPGKQVITRPRDLLMTTSNPSPSALNLQLFSLLFANVGLRIGQWDKYKV